MSNAITRRIINLEPYPGLRPFRPDEAHLFFGREVQVDKLLEKIQYTHFVAVIGPSGCGKSSLVKAGLIPELKTGMLINEASKSHIIETHPGDAPYKNLADSLHKTVCAGSEPAYINAELKRSHKGLSQVLKCEINPGKENVLLLVDQFEELFRYRQNNNIDEVMAYISLLIYAARQEEVRIHVVITMRSDFLGECSLFPGLPEMLNDNQFLTPRLTREQLKEAIESPALVCGGSLDALLVNTLLNDIGVDHDQLPLLQHVLKRMWVLKKEVTVKTSSQDNGVNQETSIKVHLVSEDYVNIGKLNYALSDHANILYDKRLDDEQKHITEVMFRRMSERSADRKDIRIPVQIREIADIVKVNVEEVIKVADYFRDPEYNFISPASDIPLKEDSFIDISHESIIRQWDKMRIWLEMEYEASTRYVRWIADAGDYFKGKGELLTGIDLKYILEWNSSNKTNEAWALRYGSSSDFEMVRNYTRLSNRKRKTSKMIGYGVRALITTLVLATFWFAWDKQQREKISQLEKHSYKLDSQFRSQKAVFESMQFKSAIETSEKEIELKRVQMDELNEKNDTITQKNILLSQQFDELKQRNIIREIQRQPVYESLDGQDREMAEKILVPLYERGDSMEIDKFLRLTTKAKLIEENTYKQDPNDNFYEAGKMLRDSKSPLVRSILLKGLNKNLYYKQKLSLNRRVYDRYTFVIAADKKNFALATGAELLSGIYSDGSLVPEREFGRTIGIKSSIAEMAGSGKRIVALAYPNRRLLALWNQGGQLFEYTKNGAKEIGNMNIIDAHSISRLSPSGNLLVSAPVSDSIADYMYDSVPDRSIRLWNLAKPEAAEKKIDSTQYGVRTIKFSLDEKSMILILNNDAMQVWTISGTPKKVEIPGISAATFSPDTNFILTISTSYTSHKMRKLNMEGAATGFNEVDVSLSIYEYVIRDITINESGTRLLIKGNQALWVVERRDGDSLFKREGVKGSPVIIKNFPRSQRFAEGVFVDTSTIVTLNDLGEMSLWKDYPPFKTPDEALKIVEVQTPSKDEMLADDSMELKKLIAGASAGKLDSLASRMVSLFYSTTNSEKRMNYGDAAVKIYQRLSEITSGDERKEYVNQMVKYNDEMISSLRTKLSLDNAKLSLYNTEVYLSLVNRLRLSIGIRERLHKENENDTIIAKALSANYWNVSWYLLFLKDFNGAIAASSRGLNVWEKNNGIITNMASGYLLSGNFNEADRLYDQYKNESYINNPQRKFRKSFLKDLDDLEQAGIISPANPKVYQHVGVVRKKLSGE